MPRAIWALAIGSFAICTSEFVIMGLLQEVAQNLSITIPQSGFLITAYAIGVVLGAPLLTPFLVGLKRKPVLIGLMLLFMLGNVACALSPNYTTMLVSRFLTAFSQAAFFGLGAVVAARLVEPNKQASAIAAMFLGATLANILGAPIGTFLGQEIGWRSTFYVIAIISAVSALSISKLLPNIEFEEKTNIKDEFIALIQPDTLRALLITAFGFGGTFTVFTYISPILTKITGMPSEYVPAILLIFGVGMALGNPIGAKFSNLNVIAGMRATLLMLISTLVALYFCIESPLSIVVAMFFFGAATFATIPSLQTHVLSEAGKAPVLASAFNIASFNLGNAAGAWLGGESINSGMSIHLLPLVAAGVSGVGFFLSLTAGRKRVDVSIKNDQPIKVN
ncbi:MFS transporter [Vibrio sp. S4M6]|uniref:MFS transporter n=1 Tax=Vibrio sinus TaxID=2946865 RepID=UPI00202A2283|nr:MFS transporter [Vibrio sinus]MCL9780034.1 MFS transporter [Vibrio sinus]